MVATPKQALKEPSHFNDWPNAQGFDSQYVENSPVELDVEGTIPSYASGTLFRTGAGPREVTSSKKIYKVNHWFDQFALVHRFRIHAAGPNGEPVRVTYNSRSTCDKVIERIRTAGGKKEATTFGTKYDPCRTFFQKVQSMFYADSPATEPSDVNNGVTLSGNFPGINKDGKSAEGPHASSELVTLCAKTDAARLQFLNPETLEPTGVANQAVLHPELKGPLSAAHSKSDPVTSDVYNFNLELGKASTYRIFRVHASTGKTSVLATFGYPAAYIHSMFLTENYVILCVWNSFFTAGGASVLWYRNIMEAMKWDGTKPTKWFVVDKKPVDEGGRGLVAVYDSDPFFCFHTINAYEQPSSSSNETEIVADLFAYKDIDCIQRFYIDNLLSDSPDALPFSDESHIHLRPSYQRYILPSIPSTKISKPLTQPFKVISQTPTPNHEGLELPVINPHYVTKPHRYIYGAQDTGLSTFFDGLAKFDVSDHSITRWSKHGHTASEPIFIPDPNRSHKEDGGVLLTVVLDGTSGKSYLLVLDAEDMSEMGKAKVDGVCGFGFHGLFSGDGSPVGKLNGLDV